MTDTVGYAHLVAFCWEAWRHMDINGIDESEEVLRMLDHAEYGLAFDIIKCYLSPSVIRRVGFPFYTDATKARFHE